MTKQLMRKYKCHLCRVQDHLWPSCPHLKHWNIKKKPSHPRPNPNESNGSANAVSAKQTNGPEVEPQDSETSETNTVSASSPNDLMDNEDGLSLIEEINPLDDCIGKATHVHEDDDTERHMLLPPFLPFLEAPLPCPY